MSTGDKYIAELDERLTRKIESQSGVIDTQAKAIGAQSEEIEIVKSDGGVTNQKAEANSLLQGHDGTQ